MNLVIPSKVIPASEMERPYWIRYKWENVQTFADNQPMYLCTGVRDIAEAEQAARDFDTWLQQGTPLQPAV